MQLRLDLRLLVAGVLVSVLATSPQATAHESQDCTALQGTFWSAVSGGPGCNSPIGFCTEGQLTGDITGTYHFEMTSMTPVPGDEALGHYTFTGVSTITTAQGVMYGQDHGELYFAGDNAFMTIVGVVGGNACYQGVHGQLTAVGNLNLVTGLTEGTYTSRICHAVDCFRRSPVVDEVNPIR